MNKKPNTTPQQTSAGLRKTAEAAPTGSKSRGKPYVRATPTKNGGRRLGKPLGSPITKRAEACAISTTCECPPEAEAATMPKASAPAGADPEVTTLQSQEGSPEAPTKADLERFVAKTRKKGDCRLWRGGLSKDGYGRFQHRGKECAAHRVALTWNSGAAIPKDAEVHHSCGNRACVNPAHLSVVDHAENMYATRKETCGRGHPRSKDSSGSGCRECHREDARKYRANAKLASPRQAASPTSEPEVSLLSHNAVNAFEAAWHEAFAVAYPTTIQPVWGKRERDLGKIVCGALYHSPRITTKNFLGRLMERWIAFTEFAAFEYGAPEDSPRRPTLHYLTTKNCLEAAIAWHSELSAKERHARWLREQEQDEE